MIRSYNSSKSVMVTFENFGLIINQCDVLK